MLGKFIFSAFIVAISLAVSICFNCGCLECIVKTKFLPNRSILQYSEYSQHSKQTFLASWTTLIFITVVTVVYFLL